MNRFLLTVLALSLQLQLLGQMLPLSDHYVYNALAINPAFAGSEEALSATVFYRNQWVGFKDAPKSQMLSVHAPVFNDRIGLGLLIENNTVGIFKETNFLGSYSYRMELRDGKLSFGLAFGATVYNNAWNELDATDPNDYQLMNNPTSAVLPAFSLGTYYYTKKYFIGFSLPLLLSHPLNQSTGKYELENSFSGYNYFLTGGYEFSISPMITFTPSMLVKYHPQNAIQIDYNTLFGLKDKVWVGLSYRSQDILVAMVQCQLNYQFRISYSYDFNMSSMGKYMGGSHEIVLNYVFRYNRKVIGPREF
jgi:type IX secretion system PorP/SprF family membrane protein